MRFIIIINNLIKKFNKELQKWCYITKFFIEMRITIKHKNSKKKKNMKNKNNTNKNKG